MRYRIEYLITQTEAVCSAVESSADLEAAQWQARLGGADARLRFGAAAFQIRDLRDAGRIVALETFADPLGALTLGLSATLH